MHHEITAALAADAIARRVREAEQARAAAMAEHPSGRGRRLGVAALPARRRRRDARAPRTPVTLARAKW